MKRKILIIEDHSTMRRNLAMMLEMEGYTTLVAQNGRSGIEVARREQPDLILCDIMMPEMDGHEVVRVLREDKAFTNTPFIFLTARGEHHDVREGMNAGADDYLVKPAARADVLAAVGSRLARAGALQQCIDDNAATEPDFTNPAPLQRAHGLTAREAEVLLWVAQGKSNAEVSVILGMSEHTAKQHLGVCFQKLGVESRNAATIIARETLASR